jgi:chorismate mutase/prephenate dehydratase
LRARLDELDTRLVTVVAEREKAIEEVARLKASSDVAVRDLLREQHQLERLCDLAKSHNLSAHLVERIWNELLEHSLRLQLHHLVDGQNPELRAMDPVRVAYQGADGAYSQIAAERHFAGVRSKLVTHGHASFVGMLEAVSTGAADYGMLPVENTTAGSVNDAYDALTRTELCVVGEEVLRVEHCLLALADIEPSAIRRVYSHPQALAQCSVFLSGLKNCTVEAFTDTAMSVERVLKEGDASQAAIASERAGALHGLHVIARNIANQKQNFTRFMVVSRSPLRFDERIACKTSLIFSTRHERGALVRCLNVLADQGLNLTKLEARPRSGSPFEYLFYLDFEGNQESAAVQRALGQMQALASYWRVLGSYPAYASRAT